MYKTRCTPRVSEQLKDVREYIDPYKLFCNKIINITKQDKKHVRLIHA